MKKNNIENHDEFQELLDRIIKFTFVYSTVFSVLIYLFALSISRLDSEHFFNSFLVGEIDTWILFAGAILGGSLTVFGVVFSIIFNMKIRKRDEAEIRRSDVTKNRPYIICESFTTVFSLSNVLVAEVVLRNLTDIHIRELSISDQSSIQIRELDYKQDGTIKCNETQFIAGSSMITLQITIEFPDFEKAGNYLFQTQLVFNYKNLTGNHSFTHIVKTVGDISLSIDSKNEINLLQNKSVGVDNIFYWNT